MNSSGKRNFASLMVISLFTLTAFAQNGVPVITSGVQQVPVITTAPPPATPAPAAVVGTNPADPTPTPIQQLQLVAPSQPQQPANSQQSLPPGFPSARPPNATSPRQENFVPSEIVSAASPALKANEVRAVLRTSVGDITLKLDRVNAPQTVAHFMGLARGEKEFIDIKTSKPIKRPFYNGLIFHRVVKGTLIQTGCPFGNGRGGPGNIATIPDEVKPGMNFTRPGLVAMAPMRTDDGKGTMKNANGSQFFITLREMPEWNDQYTIFGVVEDGMDVVQKIAASKVGPTERPIKRIYLVAVEIIEQ